MNAIRSAMDDIDPRILLYGERMGYELSSCGSKGQKDNAALMPKLDFQ